MHDLAAEQPDKLDKLKDLFMRAAIENLEVTPKIAYLEPVTEKVADGVWCMGG